MADEQSTTILPTSQKMCTQCGVLQDISQFHRRNRKSEKRIACCKTCGNKQTTAWKANPRDKTAEAGRAYHAANANKIAEYRAGRRDEQHEYNVAYYAAHSPRLLETSKTYYAANSETLKEKQRVSYHKDVVLSRQRERERRTANLEDARLYDRQRYAAGYARDPEKYLKRTREYKKRHPDRHLNTQARIRAVKKGALTGAPVRIKDIAERDNWTCHICHKKVTRATWSLDHLNPLSQGGAHTPENVALAHRRCNSKRGAGRLPAQLRLLG